MRRSILSSLAVTAVLAGAPAPGLADVPPARVARAAAAAPDVREGEFVLAPQAFLVFCRRYPSDCDASGEKQVALDAATMALLQDVNRAVNRSVAPVALRGPDVWQLGLRAGHCAIYAVQKRHDLIRKGLPADALSLAVVTTRAGELHLVVVVRTDRGAFVLDNIDGRVRPWTATSYTYRRIQSRDNPMLWVSVAGSRPVSVEVAERREPAAKLRTAATLAAGAPLRASLADADDPDPFVALAALAGAGLTQE